ncbi:MAG TPA: hypothetical protein VK919_10495 [Solirubrobacterales bacterium]|nr:hypothetical protein [Solirubrobacterales bacterium]
MSLEFLEPAAADAVARSPMDRDAATAGASFAERDGWRVATGYGAIALERDACRTAIGFADVSHLGKLELQAGREEVAAIAAQIAGIDDLELGRGENAAGAWWCPLTLERALVICEPAARPELRERLEGAAADSGGPAGVVDVTTAFGALELVGPLARETFARFCAVDLRPDVTPVRGFRPGSVARTPGMILRRADERYLMLFGASFGHYVWTVVADAAESLGGRPVGVDALEQAAEPAAEEVTHRA